MKDRAREQFGDAAAGELFPTAHAAERDVEGGEHDAYDDTVAGSAQTRDDTATRVLQGAAGAIKDDRLPRLRAGIDAMIGSLCANGGEEDRARR